MVVLIIYHKKIVNKKSDYVDLFVRANLNIYIIVTWFSMIQ